MHDKELILEVLHQIEAAAKRLLPDFRLFTRCPTLLIAPTEWRRWMPFV